MTNTGKAYEEFVRLLYQALINSEALTKQKNIVVQSNKKIRDNCGIERQFDIYWEYELAGITYKTVIECKDYQSKISVDKIDALIGKNRDIPDIKAIFATRKGYQKGARKKAEQNRIDLLLVREQNDSDWQTANGEPLIREIGVTMNFVAPAQILNFEPLIDTKWVKENLYGDDISDISVSGLNNEIFIRNEDSNDEYSLRELTTKLSARESNEYGIFYKDEKFNFGWFWGKTFRYKIKGYNVKYLLSEPYSDSFTIDFAKELVGVIEYLQKGTKTSIFRNGVIKDNAT